MPGPRYAPRDYTDDPAAFGKTEVLSWPRTTGAVELTRRRAALLQHQYVRRIRKRLKVEKMSVAEFAKKSGSSYHRMSRLLRGEVVMRLEDIAIADLILDEISEFAVNSAHQRRNREGQTAASQSEVDTPSPDVRRANRSEQAIQGVPGNSDLVSSRTKPHAGGRLTADEMKAIARKRNGKGA